MADPTVADDPMIGTQLAGPELEHDQQSDGGLAQPMEETQEELVPSVEEDSGPLSDIYDHPEPEFTMEDLQEGRYEAEETMEDLHEQELEQPMEGLQDEQYEPEEAEDLQEEQHEQGETVYDAQGQQHELEEAMEDDQPRRQEATRMIGDHEGLQEPERTTMEPDYVRHEREDSTSLFIPEHRAPTIPPAAGPPSSEIPPPSRSTPRSMSTFARIRNLQKKLQQSKAAASRASAAHLYQPAPDSETYLEAVTGVNAQAADEATSIDEWEKANREATEAYKKQKRYYEELKRKNGHLSFREDVQWLKIQAAEKARREKRKRDMLKEQEEQEGEPDLFPEIPGPNDRKDNDSDDGDMLDLDPTGSSRKRRRPENPRKEPKHMSIQDAEIRSMQVALDADGDFPKKKRKGQSASGDSQPASSSSRPKSSRSQNHGGSRSKAAGKTTTKRKSAKQKAELKRAVHQATSFFNSNVFDQQAAEDAIEQPTFRSRNKADALKELIASVPIENQKTAKSDKSALLAATKEFDGRGSVKPDGNSMWLVKGMKTSLKAYQLMGSAFMRRRENAAEEPRGGLMADQMGLGKTLMMLANIVNGHPGKGAKHKTTLLVASPALLTQWGREIETHTNAGLKIMRYGPGTRIDSNHSFDILEFHDIILTTYTEIMRSYPKNEPPTDCQTADEKIAWWKKTYETHRGVLHRMMFHRIVLDEAQAIKNHTGRTSIACRALMAQHKWALSGTPILNGLTELYPYFKFLDVPHTGSFKIFKHNYCDSGDAENTERLLVRLSQFMIRRTHADEMFGAPILKLPKADQVTHWCDFNSVERSIYDIVHQRFVKKINMCVQKGELDKSYSNVLVMLLRLRQLTAHVLMLQLVMRDLLEREDIERIREVVKEAAADSKTSRGRTIIAIRKQLEVLAIEEKKRTAQKPTKNAVPEEEDLLGEDDAELEEDDDVFNEFEGNGLAGERNKTGKTFGKDYNFKPFLASLTTGQSWEKVKKKAMCGTCKRQPVNLWITSCGHLICSPCYDTAQIVAAEQSREHGICKACGFTFTEAHAIDPDQEDSQEYYGPETRSKRKRHDKERQRIEQEDIADDWLAMGGKDGVLPSAKTIAIKAQILNWVKENKDVKVIIYTQFLAMIRILAKMCGEEGWETEQYHGKLSFNSRDKAISNFAENPNVRVLLASLRCGGLGLNLTMASRVIIIDPWWNSAAEQQAFCRVFRYGQKETTFLTRFCVNNTVDQRLIEMQETKKKEIEEVMEDKGTTAKKMSIRDLMRLFGNIRDDDTGKPFIMVDNPDPRGGFRADGDHEGYADEL